jgi:hypothetical protein
VSTSFERPPEAARALEPPAHGGLSPSASAEAPHARATEAPRAAHAERLSTTQPPATAEDTTTGTTTDAATDAAADAATDAATDATPAAGHASAQTLSSLPLGARLVVRCRKDWRVAAVAGFDETCVRLSVASPTGHTYRLRRPHAAPLTYEGAIPLLGELTHAGWRAALARYDARW